MRVILVTHQFFPAFYTGVERLSLNLATQLQRMGHDVSVVTSAEHSSGGVTPYAYDGVSVTPVAAGRIDLARPWLAARRAGRALEQELGRVRPDVVHVMHPMRLPQVFGAAEQARVPLVCQLADFFYPCARVTMVRVDGSLCTDAGEGAACVDACRIRAGVERFEWGRRCLQSAAAVVSPSRFAIELSASLGFDTSDWHHIPWGVDYSLHARRPEEPAGDRLVIGFLGTLLPHKGAHVVVRALQLIPAAPLELRLFGGSFHEQSYEASLRGLAARDERVSFRGAYDHADLPAILSELDAVVIPSLWHENLPSVGLNAVAAAVPVLASDVGGLRELVDEYQCGLTFGAGDEHALAALLQRVVDLPELLRAARRSMSYPPSVEEEAWRLEALYERVISH